MWYGARSMPPSRFACRCLVFLLLVAATAGFLAPLAEAAKRPFANIVDAAARRHGVDADLVHAVIAVESGYHASAQSPAGAQGLMQLMPGTQRDLGVSDAFDPRQNVEAGVAYLRRLTDEFGTVLALAAYNAGPGAVRRYNGIPPYEETHAYVRAVLGRGRPAADAQAAEEHDPSGDRTHAGSEADLAESAPVEPRLQDDHPAADGAAGLAPKALDEAAEPDPLERVVEFLNAQMAGIESARGGDQAVQGRFEANRGAAGDRQNGGSLSGSAPPKLDRESFLKAFDNPEHRSVAIRLLGGADESGAIVERYANGLGIRIPCSHWEKPVCVASLFPPSEWATRS